MSSNQQSATTANSSSNNGVSRPIVVVLLLIIAAQFAVIAGLIATRPSGDCDATEATGTTATAAATTEVQEDNSAVSEASGEATPVASQTDENVLALLHGEVTREDGDPRALGDVDAPVVLVLYSDFACPYCTLWAQDVEPELQDLVDDGTLRIEWRDLAQITETSPLAAQAGIAAANQGKFWEFHDVVYAAADPNNHPEYTQDSLVEFAKQAGVADLDQFVEDMNAEETVTAVTDAKQHAYDLGISGTPFSIINDTYISGYTDAATVRATILDQAANS